MTRFLLAIGTLALLGGGAFACLYGFIAFTDPQFRNRRHGYTFTLIGVTALTMFLALWRYLR